MVLFAQMLIRHCAFSVLYFALFPLLGQYCLGSYFLLLGQLNGMFSSSFCDALPVWVFSHFNQTVPEFEGTGVHIEHLKINHTRVCLNWTKHGKCEHHTIYLYSQKWKWFNQGYIMAFNFYDTIQYILKGEQQCTIKPCCHLIGAATLSHFGCTCKHLTHCSEVSPVNCSPDLGITLLLRVRNKSILERSSVRI